MAKYEIPMEHSRLCTLCFVDNEVVIAQDKPDKLAEKAGQEYQKSRCNHQHRKPKYLTLCDSTTELVLKQGKKTKGVTSLTYLVVICDKRGKSDAEIWEENMVRKSNN